MKVWWKNVPGSWAGVEEATFTEFCSCSSQNVSRWASGPKLISATGCRNCGNTVWKVFWCLSDVDIVHKQTQLVNYSYAASLLLRCGSEWSGASVWSQRADGNGSGPQHFHECHLASASQLANNSLRMDVERPKGNQSGSVFYFRLISVELKDKEKTNITSAIYLIPVREEKEKAETEIIYLTMHVKFTT